MTELGFMWNLPSHQVNLELFAALSYIMNKEEIKKTKSMKVEKTKTVIEKMSIFFAIWYLSQVECQYYLNVSLSDPTVSEFW